MMRTALGLSPAAAIPAGSPSATPPLASSPASPKAAAASRRSLRRQLEYDRRYFLLASALWGVAIAKRAPLLGRSDVLQNAALLCWLLAHVALVRLAPRWYLRWSPLLRALLLAFAYCLPVLTSLDAVRSVVQAPSELAIAGPLIDFFLLWLGTRIGFLSWALVGCRPPLYLAVPFQLAALWRVHTADFCSVQALQHPVFQRRADLVHLVLALVGGAGSGSYLAALIPSSPDQRCRSLLLFFASLLGGLAPLLWLVPLREAEHSQPPPPGAAGWLPRAERRISGALQLLRWSEPRGRRPGAICFGELPPLLVRWLVVVVVLWAACCSLGH